MNDRGANPQGLATFDPMTDPGYRAVARRVVDRYLREHGLPPWTWPEDGDPIARIQQLADAYPDAKAELAGGLRRALRVEDLTEGDLARIQAARVEPQDDE